MTLVGGGRLVDHHPELVAGEADALRVLVPGAPGIEADEDDGGDPAAHGSMLLATIPTLKLSLSSARKQLARSERCHLKR